MTEEEKKLLIEIKKIDAILDIYTAGGDLYANIATQRQLNIILSKLKKAYPTVRYKQNIDSCEPCINNFLNEILPVRDRLLRYEKTQKTTEIFVGDDIKIGSDIVIGSVEYNKGNVNEINPFNPIGHDDVEEVKQVKKAVTRKKK